MSSIYFDQFAIQTYKNCLRPRSRKQKKLRKKLGNRYFRKPYLYKNIAIYPFCSRKKLGLFFFCVNAPLFPHFAMRFPSAGRGTPFHIISILSEIERVWPIVRSRPSRNQAPHRVSVRIMGPTRHRCLCL